MNSKSIPGTVITTVFNDDQIIVTLIMLQQTVCTEPWALHTCSYTEFTYLYTVKEVIFCTVSVTANYVK